MVLALQEWRHWLEGAEQPFIVWTDHKHLSYICSAKRLNSQQARWALFLGRFNFTLSYRPGSCNIKPNALSCQTATESSESQVETSLPSSCVAAALMWEVESVVKEAQSTQPDPGNGPPKCLFVPDSARSHVLNGDSHRNSPVTLDTIEPGPSFRSSFGGRPSPRTHVTSFLPALSVPEVSPPIGLTLVCSSHCLCPSAPGPTLWWILLLDSQSPMETTPF